MNQSFTNGVQMVWDATSIALAKTCLRKYQYKMMEGWSPRGLSVHLRFGQHYATALEHYYKHIALGMDQQEATRAVVLEALVDTWDRPVCERCEGSKEVPLHDEDTEDMPKVVCPVCEGTGRNNDDPGAPWDSLDNYKTRESLIRSIVWYLDEFSDDKLDVVMLPGGKPAVEYSFLLPVDNDIQFSGHLDRLVNYANGQWVMDQKTTKTTITSHYFDGFSPNDQMSMYSFAGQAVFAVPVAGVIIDAAQIAVGFTRFERGFTARSKAQLDEWYDETMEYVVNTQDRQRNGGPFPMNPTACGNYGGCEFRFVCARSPDVRQQFLKGEFDKTEGWDPAARR